MRINKILFLVLVLLPVIGYCADPSVAVDSVTAFVSGKMMAMAGLVSVILEAVLRLVPSEKPRSLLLLADKLLKSIAALCSKCADFLDKVIPQNLKDDDSK